MSEASLDGSVEVRSVEVLIEKLIPDGVALGRLSDGRVVMLNGAAPGDRVLLEEFSEKKGLVRAQRWALLDASSERVTPRCPVASECGGCDWMMLSDNEQRRSKLSLLEQALRRTAKLADAAPRSLDAGERRYGYRCRIRLHIADGRIGFRRRGSHELVEPAQCVVSEPAVNAALARVRELAGRHPGSLAPFSELEIMADTSGAVGLYFEGERPEGEGAEARALFAELSQEFRVARRGDAVGESALLRFELLDGVYLLAPAGTFTQVNWEVNLRLLEALVTGAQRRQVASFLDLYAGAGNFTLPLLSKGMRGVSVESAREAAHAAREAARRQNFTNGRFWARDVKRAVESLAAESRRYDLVIVDPPRAGVKHGLLEMAALSQGWVVLCSCNPVTLSRDLKVLLDAGYAVEELSAFDMFPQTHHLEAVVWLRVPPRQRPLLA